MLTETMDPVYCTGDSVVVTPTLPPNIIIQAARVRYKGVSDFLTDEVSAYNAAVSWIGSSGSIASTFPFVPTYPLGGHTYPCVFKRHYSTHSIENNHGYAISGSLTGTNKKLDGTCITNYNNAAGFSNSNGYYLKTSPDLTINSVGCAVTSSVTMTSPLTDNGVRVRGYTIGTPDIRTHYLSLYGWRNGVYFGYPVTDYTPQIADGAWTDWFTLGEGYFGQGDLYLRCLGGSQKCYCQFEYDYIHDRPSKVGEMHIQKDSGTTLVLPLALPGDPLSESDIIRVMTPAGIRCADLVPTDHLEAGEVRIKTHRGIFAWRKDHDD